jgi:hypothetical protein
LIPVKRLACLAACLILLGTHALAEPMQLVNLYLPDFEKNLIGTRGVEIEDTPQGIIGALVAGGALPAGVRVLAFDENAGRLDLSREFSKALEKAGARKEPLIMGSLVNSFLDRYTLRALTVTCEGKTIKAARAVYDQPLTRYEAQAYVIRLYLSDLMEPEIYVTVGESDCSYALAKAGVIAQDGVMYDAETMFPQIAGMRAPVYTAALGSAVKISFRNQPADSATIQDYVLNRDGDIKYTVPVEPVPLDLKDGGGSFLLQPNPAACLSSDSADYLPGAVLRGFLITCRWGEDRYQYAFMLRTNAMNVPAAPGTDQSQ